MVAVVNHCDLGWLPAQGTHVGDPRGREGQERGPPLAPLTSGHLPAGQFTLQTSFKALTSFAQQETLGFCDS